MIGKDRDYSEKRDYFRMRTEMEGWLVHAGREIPVRCLDLSAKGMQVEIDEPLEPGTLVRLLIPSAHETLPGLEADGEVVRSTPLPNGRHTLGLAIHEIR